MPQKQKSGQARLDAMAKEQGFPSYAAWKAWNEKYRKQNRPDAVPQKKNFLQSIVEKIPFHPARTLGHANKKITEATKKNR
jgi:hypothetical protein